MSCAQDWKQTILHESSSIRDVITKLNENGLQIVLIVSSQQKLIGTITDGDIRRGILMGFDLNVNVGAVMNSKFLSVNDSSPLSEVRTKMRKFKIHQIPVLNEKGNVVGMHFWGNLNENLIKENTFVVMAGGKGKRLSQFTQNCPKPMLKIGEKPILQHILEHAIDEGFRDFVFSINYLGSQIESYFENGEKFGVEINYLRESSPFGTAGSLSLLKKRNNLPIVVTNGDVLSDISYSQMIDYHSRSGVAATMATRLHRWQNPFGVVETREMYVIGYIEKPIIESQTNAGIYVLEHSLLSRLPVETYIDMPNFLEGLREKGDKVIAYPLHESWTDIGYPEDLANARLSAFQEAADSEQIMGGQRD